MPRLILSCLVIAILFCLLCGPAWLVALRFWKRGDLAAFQPLRMVWIAQAVLACGLIFVVDSMALRNPVGAMVIAFIAVSLGGAGLFWLWRLLLRATVR